MSQSSIDEPISPVENAYYNQRAQTLFFEAVMKAFADEVRAGRMSRAILAERTNKSLQQIAHCFATPANWTINTISTLLLGMGAEPDLRVIFHRQIGPPNYAHPIVRSAEAAAPVVQFSMDDRPSSTSGAEDEPSLVEVGV